MLAEIGYAVLASAMVWAGVHVVIKCNQYGVGSAWMKSVQRKGSWTASWHHWISMVKKEQLAQLQERSGMPDAALYAAERNIWGYYHKNTGEKHDAKGKARLRERAAAMSAATR